MQRRAGRVRWSVAAGALCLVAACSSAPGDGGDGGGDGGGRQGDAGPAASGSATASGPPSPSQVDTPEATEAPPPSPAPSRNPLADLAEGIEITDEPLLGADISWPQCPPGMGIPEKRSSGQPLPVPEARYVIIGLTNGPGFYPNPCLRDQVSWARENGLMAAGYSVASYPEPRFVEEHGQDGPYDGATDLGALANTGYQQALFNVRTMREAGLPSPAVWIDVEPVPDFAWSSDLSANAAVVAGIARGYQDAGFRIGVYSTPALWAGVVGDLELGVPEWRAAGQTSSEEALSRCGDEWVIQGGEAIIGQWVERNRDMNLTCPGVTDLSVWFHQF